MNKLIVSLLIFCHLFSTSAYADSTAPAGSGVPAAPTDAVKQAAPPAPQPTCSNPDVIATVPQPSVINKLKKGITPYPYPYVLKLGEFVTVNVPHDKFAENFTKPDSNIQPTPVLYIQDFAVNGLTWVASGCENFSFLLTRTPESLEVWGKVLKKLNGQENITVGIGTVQKGFIENIGTAKLVLTTEQGSTWWGLLMIILIIAIFVLGVCSGLLRDMPKKTATGELTKARDRPFSLARVQMAFWFVLTVGAYTYIWLRTGNIAHVIPDSILALMGISAGTTVVSAVVDSNSAVQDAEKATGNILEDILSDSDGISFHRLQMLVWTIVLGVVFVQKVYANWIMPDFDAQLLGLMGVSSGAYLGFKMPVAAAATAAANNAAKTTDAKAAATTTSPAQEHPAVG